MDFNKNSKHLQWLHDRIVNVYDENPNVDFLIRFREIIKELKDSEDGFETYLKFRERKRNEDKN